MATYKCSAGDKKKKKMLIIFHQQRTNREVIMLLTVLWNQDYNQSFGWEKSIFLTKWFYILSIFNRERHLACPNSLAVFINQDNLYQQNKQEKNIMIKYEIWKNCFKGTILMKNIGLLFHFYPKCFICSCRIFPKLFHFQDMYGRQRY